jgi:hypothetical protein
MNYENKSKEELIELLEELQQENKDLKEEIKSNSDDNKCYEDAISYNETRSERVFYSGYKSGKDAGLAYHTGNTYESNIKAWLNFKIGEGI